MFASAKGKQQKYRFDSHNVRNGVFVISHITFWDCSMHIFSDKLSQNSCIFNVTCLQDLFKIYQVTKEKVSTALSYYFTLLFSLTQLGDDGVLRYGFLCLRAVMSNTLRSASFSKYENESTITCGKNDDPVLSLRDKLL